MQNRLLSLLTTALLALWAGQAGAWLEPREGALELEDVRLALSSAGTATITGKPCDQCEEMTVVVTDKTDVVGPRREPRPNALQTGYSGGATIKYDLKTLRVTQIVLWQ
ncbi:MAG: hypothetical protein AAGD86_00275 [Pseudomonadota bacterium]